MNTYTLRKFFFLKAFALLTGLMIAVAGYSCDGSGIIINQLVDNEDGTFTLDMTIQIAGIDYVGQTIDGTRGFSFTINQPILSIFPTSFTSQNGITLTGMVNGNSVSWGDPINDPYFVGPNELTQTFDLTLVLDDLPTNWTAAGFEGNHCPGGPGTSNPSPGYSGILCIPPTVRADSIAHICQGEQVTLFASGSAGTVLIWSNGLVGSPITIAPSMSTVLTVTAINACGTATKNITVIVEQEPVITPFAPQEICEGEILSLSLDASGADSISWSIGAMGPNITFLPVGSGSISVAVFNECGEDQESIPITVFPLPEITVIDGNQTICAGETATLSVTLSDVDSLIWSNGSEATSISVNPAQSAFYTATAFNACGQSSVSVFVQVLQADTMDVMLQSCTGSSILYNGQNLMPGDSASFSLVNQNGCDSIVNVVVAELPVFQDSLTFFSCPGVPVLYNAQAILPGEAQTFVFQSLNGCDSSVFVQVNPYLEYSESLTLQACTGSSALYNGTNIPAGSSQVFSFLTANGCDSVVTVVVEEVFTIQENLELSACSGTTVFYNGQFLAAGSSTSFTFQAQSGCDSMVLVNVLELP
ncbi:MAG TPA: hypothetical protein PKA70_23085, partial [Saprospiraceae bacterium]|nr:hypothetical protein [Saprospiraceae bacterium]